MTDQTPQARRAEIADWIVTEWMIEADANPRGIMEWCVKDGLPSLRSKIAAELSRLTAQVEGMSAPEGYVLVPVTDLTNVAAGIERHTQRESVSKVASDRMGEWSQQLRALAARPGVEKEEGK